MGRAIFRKVIRISACLIGIGIAGAVCLGLGWAAGEFLHAKLSHPERATAQAFATRFPEARGSSTSQRPSPLLTGLMQAKEQQVALFAASSTEPAKLADPDPAPVSVSPKPLSEAPKPDPKPAVAARRTRPNALFDDAQIATMKKRLNLTPSQERLWPAVEAELRKMTLTQLPPPHGAKGKTKPPPTIELSSAEVERLKNAAFPLIMSFNSDQREELRTMARLTGLEKYAP